MCRRMRLFPSAVLVPIVVIAGLLLPGSAKADSFSVSQTDSFGTKYSLAAGVWSADVGRIHRFVRRLKAGTVWANTFGPTDVRLPWGGARDSGFGREHGDQAIANFTEPKAVWINIGK